MQRPVRLIGTSYDWTRELASCDPDYYRWNQWFFVRLFEKGLAYKREAPVNWCPVDQTVLANEQVEDGRCWRCGAEVERRNLAQWFFKITDYVERLLAGLDRLDGWPERIKAMQRNWIGKSEGVTFVVRRRERRGADRGLHHARRHGLRRDVRRGRARASGGREDPRAHAQVAQAASKSSPRSLAQQERARAHAADGEDRRADRRVRDQPALAREDPDLGHELRARRVRYRRGDGRARARRARLRLRPQARAADRAGDHDGRRVAARAADRGLRRRRQADRVRRVHRHEVGERAARDRRPARSDGPRRTTTHYRIRDWLVSRQRYWGTPIPIVYCEKDGTVAVPDDQLPVVLPKDVQFTGQGSPLATTRRSCVTTCPRCGGPATRDPDTMDTSWTRHGTSSAISTRTTTSRVPAARIINGIVITGGDSCPKWESCPSP